MNFLEISYLIFKNVDLLYTFILLFSRYAGFFLVVPGLGGMVGVRLKIPGIMIMAIVSTKVSPEAHFPDNLALILSDISFEFMMGVAIGFLPLIIVSGVGLAVQLASNMMGLNASNIIDPSSGNSIGTLTRMLEELMVVVFLIIGGHYVLLRALVGLDGQITPGVFRLDESILEFFILRVGYIFEAGVILSVPVIVALLLTQFVMGLITKAVPAVNIFIISFPLTIGIGLILISLSIPEISKIIIQEFSNMEEGLGMILASAGMPRI